MARPPMGETSSEGDISLDYDRFMGRWSALIAARFIDWLQVPPGRRWVDVGCGTGSLTAVILARAAPLEVWGIDPERANVRRAVERLGGDRRHFMVGDAQALPGELRGLDVAVSGLVLNLLPDPAAGLREQVRVTRPGGVVAAYVWDFADGMRLLRHLWDAARTFDPEANALDQGRRYALCRPAPLRALFESVGLAAVDLRHAPGRSVERALAIFRSGSRSRERLPRRVSRRESHGILLNRRLSSVAGCSTVVRADKSKLTERWGRKASGLRTNGL